MGSFVISRGSLPFVRKSSVAPAAPFLYPSEQNPLMLTNLHHRLTRLSSHPLPTSTRMPPRTHGQLCAKRSWPPQQPRCKMRQLCLLPTEPPSLVAKGARSSKPTARGRGVPKVAVTRRRHLVLARRSRWKRASMRTKLSMYSKASKLDAMS